MASLRGTKYLEYPAGTCMKSCIKIYNKQILGIW